MPVGVNPDQVAAFARLARARASRTASIVGPAEAVLAFWDHLKLGWRRPRQVFDNQLLMEITGRSCWPPDPTVRQATTSQFELIVPAAMAMFTEELGFAPPDRRGGYRNHVANLLKAGAVYVRTDANDTTVEFKADVAAVLANRAQVQGVWTKPALRGSGLAKAGMAAVIQAVNQRGIQAVSLYVNHYNHPAIACYQAIGFRQVGQFATVLF